MNFWNVGFRIEGVMNFDRKYFQSTRILGNQDFVLKIVLDIFFKLCLNPDSATDSHKNDCDTQLLLWP